MSIYSIGELSKLSSVKVPTIRYYEKEGLLREPPRTEGNQRRYDKTHLSRLIFIRHARDLGLPMPAVRKLLDLSDHHPETPCTGIDEIAREQLGAIRKRIQQLRQLEDELARIVASCDGNHPVSECNVLRAFGDHSQCHSDHQHDPHIL